MPVEVEVEDDDITLPPIEANGPISVSVPSITLPRTSYDSYDGIVSDYLPAFSVRGTIDVGSSDSNKLEIFVDESGHLCIKHPNGEVSYVVLSTIPPEHGAVVTPPSYEKPTVSVPVVVAAPKITPIKTLWEHLQDEDR